MTQQTRNTKEMVANLRTFLSDSGINPTRQRLAIAKCIFARQQHLSAENILQQVNSGDVPVSKATVYNTLTLFVQNGILRKVAIDPDRTLFDTNVSEHHHILNIETGALRDIDPVVTVRLPHGPGLLQNERIEGIDLVLRVRNKKDLSS